MAFISVFSIMLNFKIFQTFLSILKLDDRVALPLLPRLLLFETLDRRHPLGFYKTQRVLVEMIYTFIR
jgi:hypothetical protein